MKKILSSLPQAYFVSNIWSNHPVWSS